MSDFVLYGLNSCLSSGLAGREYVFLEPPGYRPKASKIALGGLRKGKGGKRHPKQAEPPKRFYGDFRGILEAFTTLPSAAHRVSARSGPDWRT